VKRILVSVLGLVALLALPSGAQELVITGFPLGVGATVGEEFFEPYYAQLQSFADVLQAEPTSRIIIVGQADGARYTKDNDAKNPGLSLGRAHALRNVLVGQFQVDPTQIFIQSSDIPVRGDQYRAVGIRIERPTVATEATMVPVSVPVQTEAPVNIVENTNYFSDQMTLRLGAGVSSGPYGALPMVSGSVIWNRKVSLEFVLGHTFWNQTYQYQGANLETWQRMVGARFAVYPWKDKPIGFVAGWSRIEEIAQSFYEYVKLSEGPVLGVNVLPWKHVSIAGLYNPARQRIAENTVSSGETAQFLISISLFTDLGGTR
jgi:hypothetical protein